MQERHVFGVGGRCGHGVVFIHGRRLQTVDRKAQLRDFEIEIRAGRGEEVGAGVTAHVE